MAMSAQNLKHFISNGDVFIRVKNNRVRWKTPNKTKQNNSNSFRKFLVMKTLNSLGEKKEWICRI